MKSISKHGGKKKSNHIRQTKNSNNYNKKNLLPSKRVVIIIDYLLKATMVLMKTFREISLTKYIFLLLYLREPF